MTVISSFLLKWHNTVIPTSDYIYQCMMFVLGVTWIFGFLALSDTRLVFQYMFCIFNSIQGFLIFIMHNIREKVVREAWRDMCCCQKKDNMASSFVGTYSNSTVACSVAQSTKMWQGSSQLLSLRGGFK